MWKAAPEYNDLKDFREVRRYLTTSAEPSDGALQLPERTPISSQGLAGTCAANAACDAGEQVMPSVVQLSRRFVYWNALRMRREEAADNGTDLYACFTSMQKQGICEESVWPYDDSAVLERPSLEAYERAYDNRLATFYALRPYGQTICLSIDDALHTGYPVAFGLAMNAAQMRGYKGGDDIIQAPSVTDTGHAMLIVGYRTLADGTKAYLFRNSWGPGWGNRGYGWISSRYVSSILYGPEFYVPISIPLANAENIL